MYLNESCTDNQCIEGCFCPEGTVLNSEGKCVTPEFCPCIEKGFVYYNGQEFEKKYPDCQRW